MLYKCFANGGTVLAPVFSLGRTQELLYEREVVLLSRQFAGLKALRMVVDSPLAGSVWQLKPYCCAEAYKRLYNGRHPLSFEELITVDDHKSHSWKAKGSNYYTWR